MSERRYDLAVIGGGPGGYAAALYAANAGLSVALVEKDMPGGTCLHRGCIPAKAFLETAHVARTVARAGEFGIRARSEGVDFAVAQQRKQAIVGRLFQGLSGLLRQRKVDIVKGEGRLAADRRILVDGVPAFVADHVILATGSVPRRLDLFPANDGHVMTSDEVLSLDALPGRAAIVGAGVIGLEFASMMIDLGVAVTVLEVGDRALAGLDKDVADVVIGALRKRGVDIRTGVRLTGYVRRRDGVRLSYEGGSVDADAVVLAIGRSPATDGLVAPEAGVRIAAAGTVEVDGLMRTTAPGVYAVGDIVATPQLAHVAFSEAMVAVKHIIGEAPQPIDYGLVPWAVYTSPEAAFVGMSEAQARAAGIDVVVRKETLGGNGRAMIVGETEGLIKVIARRGPDGRAGVLVGVHMAGPWVTEQLAAPYLAANWEAAPDDIAPLVFPHPSMTEAMGEAFIALTGRGLHLP